MHLRQAQGSSIFRGLDADVFHMWMFLTPLPKCFLLLILYEKKIKKKNKIVPLEHVYVAGYSSAT